MSGDWLAQEIESMKKVIVLYSLMSLTSIVSAQTTRYDVNVYTNPLPMVEYTKPMGDTYQKMMQLYQGSSRITDAFDRMQLENEQRMMEIERIKIAAAEGAKIVSEEVTTFNGVNLATKGMASIKARVAKSKNGRISISCLGIKIGGGSWKPCEKPISSLQDMYKNVTSENERSMVLELMDLGNYLLDTGTEVYILK